MTLHLALEIDGDGAHPQAWRRAEHPPAGLLTREHLALRPPLTHRAASPRRVG